MHENKYNFSGLTFNTSINEIKMFEKNNSCVSVKVFGFNRNSNLHIKLVTYKVFPLKVVNKEKYEHLNLFLLNEDNKKITLHLYL